MPLYIQVYLLAIVASVGNTSAHDCLD